MVHVNGQEFVRYSVPLVYEERHFIMELGDPHLITVLLAVDGQPSFEVLKNKPFGNALTLASLDAAGVVTVRDNANGNFLYRVSPGSETVVIFRRRDGEDCAAVLTDREIRIGGLVVENAPFSGELGGVVVDPEIGAGMLGAPLPQQVKDWLS